MDRSYLVIHGGFDGEWGGDDLAAAEPELSPQPGTRAPVLPQRLAGKDLFWWLTRLGLMRVTAESRVGRRLRARPDFIIGSSLDASTVIWTTGYRPDYSWMHIPGVVGDGHLVHRRGVTNIPGLYFLGLPWQHSRGSALLGFVREDAAYLADRITSRVTSRVTSRAPDRQPAARPAFQQPG